MIRNSCEPSSQSPIPCYAAVSEKILETEPLVPLKGPQFELTVEVRLTKTYYLGKL
jgi:hypothetical protein